MTFGVVQKEDPLLEELIALAFETAGHDCLVLENAAHATRVLQSLKVDAMVLDLHMPDVNALDWLENIAVTWPYLPASTLVLTRTALTPEEMARVERLGADVIFKPSSLVGVELIVMARLQKARAEQTGRSPRGWGQETTAEMVH